MKELSTEQTEAVMNIASKNVLCLAGPGSGKTEVLAQRIAQTIEFTGRPTMITAITFTVEAAREILKRVQTHRLADGNFISESMLKIGYIGTLHGWALQLIQRHPDKSGFGPGLTVIDEEESLALLKQTADRMKYKGSIKALQEIKRGHDRASTTDLPWLVVAGYYRELRQGNCIDFDRILSVAYMVTMKLQGMVGIDYLFVDEYQDSGTMDANIYSAIYSRKFFVGDPDQCQPPGTMIRMADGKTEKPIEKIIKDDKVMTWDRHGKTLLKNGVVTAKAERPFRGKLYQVTVENKMTECTANHRWVIKWVNRYKAQYVTYLMKKGDWFRFGVSKLWRSGGTTEFNFGIRIRMAQEKADSMWILRVHETRQDALIYEQILGATYGLSLLCFKEANNGIHFEQRVIDRVFSMIPNQWQKAAKALSDHGRLFDYPMLGVAQKRTRSTVMEIEACNLLNGVMAVPLCEDSIDYKNRNPNWKEILISRRDYTGIVYSLDIASHHKYVANGIVTCNSIYGFRGGSVKSILSAAASPVWRVHTLQDNYRSTTEICRAANSLIKHNLNRVDKATKAVRQEFGKIVVSKYIDQGEECRAIIEDLLAHKNFNDSAILCRTNMLAKAFAVTLQSMGMQTKAKREEIPEDWIYARSLFLAMLKPSDDRLAFRLIEIENGTDRANKLKLEAQAEGRPLMTGIGLNSWRELDRVLHIRNISHDSISLLHEVVSDPTQSLAEISAALIAATRQIREEGTGITVTTIHASKGREYENVYLPAWDQEIFPGKKTGDDLEEERRLAYVAITRAKDRCLISYVCKRINPFTQKIDEHTPSVFIKELL